MAKDFFISRTGADKQWAQWIAWQLEEEGYEVVLQDWDFNAGESFVRNIQKAAEEFERTIAVLSPDYFNAEFTAVEWEVAFTKDPRGEYGLLIPVVVRECEIKGVLSRLSYISLVGLSEQAAKELLISSIRQYRSKPSVEPNFPGIEVNGSTKKPAFPNKHSALCNIPLRNPKFTGRDNILTKIDQVLHSTESPSQVIAITGLGGTGKTQIALEFAYRKLANFDVVWWLRAEHLEVLSSDYAQLASELHLPESTEKKQEHIVKAVRNWLGQNSDWLLVFDNVVNPKDLADFLPHSQSGEVIITSQYRDWDTICRSIELSTWTREESIKFLTSRTGTSDSPTADELADQLGDLPLALEQAAAYIKASRIPIKDYLDLFATRRNQLWKQEKSPSHYEKGSLEASLNLTIDKLREKEATSPAIAILNFCALLAPEKIPRSLLQEVGKYLPEEKAEIFLDALNLNSGIEKLNNYSLVEFEIDYISIHRLVQTVVSDKFFESQEEKNLWLKALIKAIGNVFPGDGLENPAIWPECMKLLPHAQHVFKHIDDVTFDQLETAALMHKVADYLYGRGSYKQAEILFRRFVAIQEKVLDQDDPLVASSINSLGNLLRTQGMHVEAENCYRRAIEIRKAQLGEKDESVGRTLNNLGTVLMDQGRYAQAETVFRQSVAIKEMHWGKMDMSVARTLRNLGNSLRNQGKYQQATPIFNRVAEIAESNADSDPLSLATALKYRVDSLLNQNKYAEAEKVALRSLNITESALGTEHPSLAFLLKDLASILKKQGKYQEAESTLDRSIKIAESGFGAESPELGGLLNNLAGIFLLQEKHLAAEQFYNRALKIKEAQLGDDHPKVANTLMGLGALYEEKGELEKAQSFFQRAYNICSSRLGLEHPNTLGIQQRVEALSIKLHTGS